MQRLAISTRHCLVEQSDGVLQVTLTRPEAKNAFSPEMLLGLYRAWRYLDEEPSLRCAILTAQGDTFCAGMDLKAAIDEPAVAQEFQQLYAKVPNLHWQALLREQRPNKPLILAVEGYALAGGTEILLGTDIRIAAVGAIFGVTEVARGLYPMAGSTVRLPRQIPYCQAAQMLLCAQHLRADQVLQFGLINEVVADGQALSRAWQIARQIAANAPLAVQAVTQLLRASGEQWPEAELMQQSDTLAEPVFASDDAREGLLAFREKRAAQFRGR